MRRRTEDDQGREVLIADMEVGYRAIHEKFTSRVTLDRPRLKILVEYIDGPFSRLENIWNFRDDPQAGFSTVEFFIAYEFRSRAARRADGIDVRRCVPQVLRRLRSARRRDLRPQVRLIDGDRGFEQFERRLDRGQADR